MDIYNNIFNGSLLRDLINIEYLRFILQNHCRKTSLTQTQIHIFMTRETKKLTAYTLKLSNTDRQSIKIICALDANLKYQYSFFDEAVKWADENKNDLVAIANPKDGSNNTYYLSSSVDLLDDLQNGWNCNATRALYTCVIQFLKFKEKEYETIQEVKLVENM